MPVCEFFPITDHTLSVLALMGSWLAGIGSLGAVITALWLARRSEKPQLTVKVHAKRVQEINRRYLGVWVFQIINVGFRTVTVESVGWRWRTRLRKIYYWEPLMESANLPHKLQPGDHVKIEAGFDFPKVLKILQSKKQVYAVIGTSIGRIEARVHPALRRNLHAYEG